MNFIPDSGKYEIVSFICTCFREVNTNIPLQRVAVEVVGWALGDVGEDLLPLLPITLDESGLRANYLRANYLRANGIGSARLAKIGECTMTHQELLTMHRAYHEQQD